MYGSLGDQGCSIRNRGGREEESTKQGEEDTTRMLANVAKCAAFVFGVVSHVQETVDGRADRGKASWDIMIAMLCF